MFKSRAANLIFTITLLLAGLSWNGIGPTNSPPTAASVLGGIRVTLSAPRSTISWDQRDPARERFELPTLFLHRQRGTTVAVERTLAIQVSGLPAQSELQMEAVSHHVDIFTGAPHTAAAIVITPDRPCTTRRPCSISWTLDGATPSDLYHLRVKDRDGRALWDNTATGRPAFAALDAWDVPVRTRGTPHYTVRVIYATLFPFARGQNDLPHRLSPGQVTDFIAKKFVPIIRETWRTQVQEWGWGEPLHPNWDTDGVVEVVITDPPFALLDGTGTYTRLIGSDGRPYPHRRIWWFSSSNSFQAYDSLENGYRAVFSHEFFHTMQWNVLLSAGEASAAEASAGQSTGLWISWIEAQAAIAPTVQYPALAFRRDHLVLERSAYTSAANRFLRRDLNLSFEDLERDQSYKYDGALYWRFLYEQYGGMHVVRAALAEMAGQFSPYTGFPMERALDATFARLDGPFHSFEESLIAFARANYALRLTNGRCHSPDLATCGGLYYDPEGMYEGPPLVARVYFDGATTTYYGAIPARIGTDFLEIKLERIVHDRPLMIRLRRENRLSRFHVQVWKVRPGLSGLRAVDLQPQLVWQEPDGTYVYAIPRVQTLAYDRVVLIITRLDTYQAADASGNYWVTVESTG